MKLEKLSGRKGYNLFAKLGEKVYRGKDKKLARPQVYDSVAQMAPDIRQKAVLTQDPNALIQTGPGLPSWRWRWSVSA